MANEKTVEKIEEVEPKAPEVKTTKPKAPEVNADDIASIAKSKGVVNFASTDKNVIAHLTGLGYINVADGDADIAYGIDPDSVKKGAYLITLEKTVLKGLEISSRMYGLFVYRKL
jgi:hypothetical protein